MAAIRCAALLAVVVSSALGSLPIPPEWEAAYQQGDLLFSQVARMLLFSSLK